MYLRKFSVYLLAAALCLPLLSCGAEPPPRLTVESVAELRTIQKLPPAYVPGGNWTEADIPGALWLGASRFSFPATYSSLTSKFSVDPEAADTVINPDKTIRATLLYEGCACGTITMSDCRNESEITSGKISKIEFYNMGRSDLPAPELFPVSFNGITIGSPADQVKENLGIELTDAGAEISTSQHTIQFSGSPAGGVTKITLISTHTDS